MISATSVKERLKNIARKENKTMQDCLVSYAMERSIYRISISDYAEHFILKGGIFLYALFGRNFPRATVDIDLLARKMRNSPEELKEIFNEIFSINSDDALKYDLKSLVVKPITEFKEYHGVNVSVKAYLDKTRIPVSIDIGFGDIVYPGCVMMDFPVLLDMEGPKIYAYSIYSVIAEKFEAIVSLGLVNSRYKDFYDIYQIAGGFNIIGKELVNAIKETFVHRATKLCDIVAFEPDYVKDKTRIKSWNAFINKKKAQEYIDFANVIDVIKELLCPIIDAVEQNKEFNMIWHSESGKWEKSIVKAPNNVPIRNGLEKQ